MKKIGLVQINTSFSGQNYFPYSAGLLQAYAQAHCANIAEYEFKDIIYKRIPVDIAVNHLKDCDIVGFSVYVWNEKISLRIASELRKINSKCLIVFGGPQVPDNAEQYMRSNRFIDIAVHGEGEHVFTLILQTPVSTTDWREWTNIPGISYLIENTFITNPKAGRLKSLDAIPSPYLNGIFDSIIKKNPDEQWLGLWETNRGCPFQCTYCDWGSAIQVKISKFDLERLYREIDWFASHKVEFIFCCDANYGILVRDIDITKYVVNSKIKTGYPMALSVQNTKNATDRSYEVQKLLASVGLNKGVTLSVQSMDKTTLENIKRDNISLASYQELQRRFMKDKVETYSDMILPLPGETYASFMDGMNEIITNGQHNRIQFNNLSILPNAEMGNPSYQAKFGMVMVDANIINMHGSLNEIDDETIQEKQKLVISTNTMPKEDWIKTRATCWMSAFLHFDKIIQMPLVIINKETGISYRKIFESFMDKDLTKNLPIIDEIRTYFINEAIKLQNGGDEFCRSKEWLNIFWPADEYIFIKLVKENKIHKFYDECYELLSNLINEYNSNFPIDLLKESLYLNKSLLKIPFQIENELVDLKYNIFEFYKSIIENDPIKLEIKPSKFLIEKSKKIYLDWDIWFKEVVWYGNKKGGYLHGNYTPNYELSGHY